MSHGIEQYVREANPVEVVGCDERKINQAIAAAIHIAGQKKRTVDFTVFVPFFLSTREVRAIKEKLRYHHSLESYLYLPGNVGTHISIKRRKIRKG